ncbi:uncharacterized protein LOC141679139 isoform X2 [Apium graveolens]|uniref:uncharacterized protein LOC141679139 isoform X2 n=1 Tax=Apium graveolens TaxID=4045 RepID=UPI003D79618A
MHFGWLPRTLKRALVGLSYVRFGDVFLRYHPFHKVKNYSESGRGKVQVADYKIVVMFMEIIAQEQLTVVAIHSACILVGSYCLSGGFQFP